MHTTLVATCIAKINIVIVVSNKYCWPLSSYFITTLVVHWRSQVTRLGRDPLTMMSLNLSFLPFFAFVLSVINISNEVLVFLAGNKTLYSLEVWSSAPVRLSNHSYFNKSFLYLPSLLIVMLIFIDNGLSRINTGRTTPSVRLTLYFVWMKCIMAPEYTQQYYVAI